MITEPTGFRAAQPLAWSFHRGTVRLPLSTPEGPAPPPEPGREDPVAAWFPLPAGIPVPGALDDLVRDRVSCRAFSDRPIGIAELATLLWTGYGVTAGPDEQSVYLVDRAVPSAGGLYPLEVSLLARAVDGLPPGVYHYVPYAEGLEQVRGGAVPAALVGYLFMSQRWAAEAAAVLVLSAVCRRSLGKYGDRGYRYLLLEAGHVAQNVVLAASGLGLGAVNLGGFFDDELSDLLGIDAESEIVLYGMAVGHPSSGDRAARRAIESLVTGGSGAPA
jgi:SagB-type dehydrogenase family enzyme